MSWKTNNFSFPLLMIFLALCSITIFIAGCLPADPADTQIVDPRGVVIYQPPLEPTRVLQVPATGRPTVDYVVGLIAAGMYAAFGYALRRSNGRIKTLEHDRAPQTPIPSRPMTAEDIARLAKVLTSGSADK